MCGIVGYTGSEQAAPILLDGLSKLEYRGYDSAGIAVCKPDGRHEVVKAKGKLNVLSDMVDGGNAIGGTCGIGHTRWATHGVPSKINAHPHYNGDKTVVAVHNGIIENFQELKDKLLSKGYDFYSQTDTEIAIKTIDYYYKKWNDPVEALINFSLRARGSFALAVMFSDYPEQIFIARKDSPLIVGVADGASYIASDVPAILKYTRNVYYMGNMEFACVQKGAVTFYNLDKKVLQKQPVRIDWDMKAAEKGGFEHFMMKEIHEQPEVVKNTLNSYIKDGKIDFGDALSDEALKNVRCVHITGCGSAYHVAMVAKSVIEKLARVPVDADVASEFRYRNPIMDGDDMVVLISQSGETADTLGALRAAKERNIRTLAVVNVLGSSIAREADGVLYTMAGPEISVATTKAYSAQLIVVYLLAVQLAYLRGTIDENRYANLLKELITIPKKIEKLLDGDERIKWFATSVANKTNAFFVGRGIDYAVCMEGSLKLKEVSYIHSDAYAAGELKHGTISLIENKTLVIGVVTQPELAEKTISNLQEVKSRGAYVFGLTVRGNYGIEKSAEFTVYIPKIDPCFSASLAVIPLQLLGYYVSVSKGLDVDKPRNLAKCVSVE